MTVFPYKSGNVSGELSTFGLAVLQSDETLEHDFQRLMPADKTRQYVSRVPNGPDVSTDSLGAMVKTLPAAVELFPPNVHLDVVGYGCTSATSVIGAEEVARLISSNCDCKHVTDPLSATIAACKHLKIDRLALLSPYIEEVSKTLRAALIKAEIQTPVFGTFDEENDSRAANIDRQSIVDAAIELGRSQLVDAVFISCTSLKTLDAIAQIERKIAKPVLSSNLVLAWHMCLLAGVEMKHERFGVLLGGEGSQDTVQSGTKEYQGCCHCGAIRFTFQALEIKGSLRCDCSICARKASIMTTQTISPDSITISVRNDALKTYQFGTMIARHHFCGICGIHTFVETRLNPGQYRINLGCIDTLNVMQLPEIIYDGKNM